MQRMLASHSRIASHPEPHLLTPLAYAGIHDYLREAPYDAVNAHQAQRAFVSSLSGGEGTYYAALRRFTDGLYGDFCATHKPSASYFLDKTPAYARVLAFIEQLYPKARYVVLTRHPLAIFSSYALSFFDGDWSRAHAYNPVLERYLPAIAQWRAKTSCAVFALSYEALVTQPEPTLRELCAFLDLSFEPGMLDYTKAQLKQGAGDPHQVDRNTRAFTRSVAKWEADVAASDARRALAAQMLTTLGPETLASWGYPLEPCLASLQRAEGAGMAAPRPPRNRYALERKVLLALREGVHERWHGRVLERVRYYCDVILRDAL